MELALRLMLAVVRNRDTGFGKNVITVMMEQGNKKLNLLIGVVLKVSFKSM